MRYQVPRNGGHTQAFEFAFHHRACKKSFLIVNCPHCHEIDAYNGPDFQDGLACTCDWCKKPFQTVRCPHCRGVNSWKNARDKKGVVHICIRDQCRKRFGTVVCPHCQGIWVGNFATCNEGSEGLASTHVHEACKKQFQAVSCPHCQEINVWKDTGYENGHVYTCAHERCKKRFQAVSCPHCSQINMSKDVDSEPAGACKSCKKQFVQLNCPSCQTSDIERKTFGIKMWECKCKICLHRFLTTAASCPHCSFWTACTVGVLEDPKKDGVVRTCAHDSCMKKFQTVACPHCRRVNMFKNAD
ncbi:unnamed protein product [Symbiodinium natans]|uniref:Uncharacterized protein n=1 Tax=Symbiodinium natans TaxID=878477 RepID=A0A812PAF9_9DINO|nr:unnamed protein product [Symbiodinium natans]